MSDLPGRTTTSAYAIRVQGHLDARWAGWFEGSALARQSDGTTVITSAVDQAGLHGLLQLLRDLGLPLLSLTPIDPPAAAVAAAPPVPRRSS
jgi:hypothetical protein